MIAQGDVFWLDLGKPIGSAPGYRHPVVVIQNDAVNRSRINTVIVCALTSNLERGEIPGNLLLRKGEANLPRRSVVSVSQLVTVDKSTLTERIGSLSKLRVREILGGVFQILMPAE